MGREGSVVSYCQSLVPEAWLTGKALFHLSRTVCSNGFPLLLPGEQRQSVHLPSSACLRGFIMTGSV